jgi:hypothetical protein
LSWGINQPKNQAGQARNQAKQRKQASWEVEQLVAATLSASKHSKSFGHLSVETWMDDGGKQQTTATSPNDNVSVTDQPIQHLQEHAHFES